MNVFYMPNMERKLQHMILQKDINRFVQTWGISDKTQEERQGYLMKMLHQTMRTYFPYHNMSNRHQPDSQCTIH